MWLLVSSATEAALGDALEATGVPVLGVGYNPSVWGGNIEAFKLACSTDPGAAVACALPNAFTLTTTFGAVVDEQVLGAKAAGATTLAVAACVRGRLVLAGGARVRRHDQGGGPRLCRTVKVSSTAGDYSAECIQLIQDGVDFVQISGGQRVGASPVRRLHRPGLQRSLRRLRWFGER